MTNCSQSLINHRSSKGLSLVNSWNLVWPETNMAKPLHSIAFRKIQVNDFLLKKDRHMHDANHCWSALDPPLRFHLKSTFCFFSYAIKSTAKHRLISPRGIVVFTIAPIVRISLFIDISINSAKDWVFHCCVIDSPSLGFYYSE